MLQEHIIPIRKLDRSREHSIDFSPNQSQIDELLAQTDWRQLKNINLAGKLSPNDDGWSLDGKLSGTVTLTCVISGAPIHKRLDTSVHRRYVSSGSELPTELSWGLDFDVDQEEMPQNLDLMPLILETISLEVPDYPKLPKYEDQNDATPWQYDEEPNIESDTRRPFANLKAMMENKNTK